MIKYLFKSELYLKLREFRSFFLLIFITTLAIISISIYDKFKFNQHKDLQSIFQNIYFQKTLRSISLSLNPRFENFKYKIEEGENLKIILEKVDLPKIEIKRIIDFILKNKIKLNLYTNQKILLEIDNLNNRKIKKITVPLNK